MLEPSSKICQKCNMGAAKKSTPLFNDLYGRTCILHELMSLQQKDLQ